MFSCVLVASLLGSVSVSSGTIVVLENSNPVVEVCTQSEVTHVAMILKVQEQLWVYEATPSEVRKLSLSEYLAEIAELNRTRTQSGRVRVRLYQPNSAYSPAESKKLFEFLNSQLGRRYSIRGYARDKPGDGIHCAELVSLALTRTGRYQFPPNYSVTPADLVTRIKVTHRAPLAVLPKTAAPRDSWCQRSWNWWASAFNWCGWACHESWTFCR